MPSRENPISDDSLLIRYLLGEFADEEAEPLDLASVTDGDFAWRLSAVENDLIDAYVRGELEGETFERFESWFLASAPRRAKVALAAALLEREQTERGFEKSEPPLPSRRRPEERRSWWLVAAAVLILVPSVYLLVPALRQKPPEDQLANGRGAILPNLPAEEPATPLPSAPEPVPSEEPGRVREPSAAAPSITAISFLVAPQTRAAESIVTVSVPPGTDELTAELQLEFDDFPRYEVVLKDPATDATLWRIDGLRAQGKGTLRTVSVPLPPTLLKTRSYSLELAGVSPDAAPEFIGNYVFRAVLE